MSVEAEQVIKVSEKLKGLLDEAITKESQLSIRYLWQHAQLIGGKGIASDGRFRKYPLSK